MFLYAEHIVVVDLAAGTASTQPFEDDLVEEVVGGAALAERLLAEYADRDPVVVATGPLTGTMVPGSSLAVLSRLGDDDVPCHVPLTLFMGSELKYSGFDAVVMLGASATPVYLWLHDGIAALEDASALWGLDTWRTSDNIKASKGDEVIQVLAVGPAGEAGAPAAQVVANYWSTADNQGFGAVLGAKKVKAVAMRGLGIIDAEEPEDLFERSLTMGEALGLRTLPQDVIEAAGADAVDAGAAREWLAPFVHRDRGCFSCAARCFTYVKFDEPAAEMRSTEVDEPGCLVADGSSLLALFRKGFSADEAGRLLAGAARRGLLPAAAASAASASGAGSAAGALSAIDADLGTVAATESAAQPADERQRLGYVLGLCPVFVGAGAAPGADDLAEVLRLGTGMELDAEGLADIAAALTGALPPRVV